MSTSEPVKVEQRRGLRRVWIPCSVLPVGGLKRGRCVVLLAGGVGPDVSDRNRFLHPPSAHRLAADPVVDVPLGSAWRIRFLGLLLLVGLGMSQIVTVQFLRDMKPSFGFRWPPFAFLWGSPSDEKLEAHRRTQGDSPLEPLLVPSDDPQDFPEFRGRRRDGVIHGLALSRDWQTNPPRLMWRQPVGGGFGGFAVAGNAAITLEQRRNQETVVCYDTKTGRERWLYPYEALFEDVQGGNGPRATPTIAGTEVFSLGAAGRLVCLDLLTGQERWATDILQNNPNIKWGMAGSPLVYDRVVVVNPGAQREQARGRALVAYDRATGKQVWTSGETPAGYSSPMLATFAGCRQILIFDGKGLGGYDAGTGKELCATPGSRRTASTRPNPRCSKETEF